MDVAGVLAQSPFAAHTEVSPISDTKSEQYCSQGPERPLGTLGFGLQCGLGVLGTARRLSREEYRGGKKR